MRSFLRFCPQCYQELPITLFLSKSGERLLIWCADCRERYRGWEKLTITERAARVRPKERGGNGYTVALILRSANRKTGRIPVSTTDMASCPPACAFRDQGCYAEHGKTRQHWMTVPDRGMSWSEFCAAVAELPDGQIWRHNEAGDLPGVGDDLDVDALAELVRANAGKRGFTFTHKPLRRPRERAAIAAANALGLTINLSAQSLEHADALADLEIAPVAIVVPEDIDVRAMKTPAGRSIVLCLNESRGLTCGECRLCAHADRSSIVAFRAHGQARAIVSEIVRSKREGAAA